MSAAEVLALQKKLARSEEKRKALHEACVALRQKGELVAGVIQQARDAKQSLQAEQLRRALAEKALEEQQVEMAAAVKLAAQAAAEAAAATQSASAARSEAAASTRQLAELQAQMQRLEAQCQGLQQAVDASVRQVTARGPDPPELQKRLVLLQSQQTSMLAEMQRWRAALGPLAALAIGVEGAAAPAAPPRPALPPPAPAAVAAVVAAATTSPTKRGQQRHRQCGILLPKHARAAATAAATGPDPAAPAPVPTAAEMRAKAVAAKQVGAASRKRPRDGTPAPAHANAFTEALGTVGAARQPFAKQTGHSTVGTALLSPRQQAYVAPMVPRAAAAAAQAAGSAAAGRSAAAEASLAVSANERHVEQQRELAMVVDEAAQLLGRITSALAPAASSSDGPCRLTLGVVHSVAADLQLRLANHRLPLPLLLTCFETAILECAAPKPQLQYLQYQQLDGEEEGGYQRQVAAAAAAPACPDATWFAASMPADEQPQHAGGPPPFAAVWCSRDALASHRLQWLLHCAAHMQKLERQYTAAAAAAATSTSGAGARGGEPLLAALRQHLHRLIVGCCLAARRKGGGGGAASGGDCSSALRHAETEVCTLTAAAAGLCRISGNAEAFWALLLDLMCCPAPANTVLPPLAAALDVWPALVQPGTAGGTGSGPAGSSQGLCISSIHAALQHLCSQVAAAAAEEEEEEPPGAGTGAAAATGSPPPLLLERQPAAASLFLRHLGQQRWGWEERAVGSSDALQEVKAALGPQMQHQHQHRRLREAPPAVAVPVDQPRPADADMMVDVCVEEI